MERARRQGKRIGRPRVKVRPEFPQRFADITERIRSGLLSRRQAAKQLSIGYAALKRYLDAGGEPTERSTNRSLTPINSDSRCSALSEVID